MRKWMAVVSRQSLYEIWVELGPRLQALLRGTGGQHPGVVRGGVPGAVPGFARAVQRRTSIGQRAGSICGTLDFSDERTRSTSAPWASCSTRSCGPRAKIPGSGKASSMSSLRFRAWTGPVAAGRACAAAGGAGTARRRPVELTASLACTARSIFRCWRHHRRLAGVARRGRCRRGVRASRLSASAEGRR